jgi:YVTN family beta-propeller protein
MRFEPYVIAANPLTNRIYNAIFTNNRLLVLDGLTNSVAATVTVGVSPQGVGINPTTNRIYVANRGGTVSVIDGGTNLVIATIPTQSSGNEARVAVNPTTNRIYVSTSPPTSTVWVIDGGTNSVLSTIPFSGNNIADLAVNPNTNRIYVTNNNGGRVWVIDGGTNSVAATTTVGTTPYAVAVNPNTNRIYVANYNSNTVSVIDGGTNSVAATIPVGANPGGIGVNPITNRIYVSNYFSNNISVIDGGTNTVIAAIPAGAGAGPFVVGVNPTSGRVYVSNQDSRTVLVIADPISSTTNLTSAPNPSVLGQSVTFTATVTPAGATGTVTFTEGLILLGTGTLNGSGTATFTTGSLSAGNHVISATYGGDGNFTPSSSAELTQAVCDPLVVTSGADDGGCGTLRYALNAVSGGQTTIITLSLAAGSVISLTGGRGLLIPAGAGIVGLGPGQCGSDGPQISIDGGGLSSPGLVLLGNNHLENVWIKGFNGVQLLAGISGAAGGNTLRCTRFSKT